jgi:hypothetical protein
MGQKRSRIGSVAATEPTLAKRRSFTASMLERSARLPMPMAGGGSDPRAAL